MSLVVVCDPLGPVHSYAAHFGMAIDLGSWSGVCAAGPTTNLPVCMVRYVEAGERQITQRVRDRGAIVERFGYRQ